MIVLGRLSQEVILACGGLLLLVMEIVAPQARRLSLFIAYSFLILAVAAGFRGGIGRGGFFWIDNFTWGFSFLILIGSLVAIAMSQAELPQPRHWATYLALILFASTGCLLLIKTRDFLYAFLAIELISISSFILVAFERKHLASLEGALKYFLVGAFSAAIGLYGISLYYAGTGHTAFKHLSGVDFGSMPGGETGQWIALAGLIMIFVSFGFKASVVPFHFWVPDAYQSAPTSIAAYLSVVPKLATLAAMIHLFSLENPASNFTAPFIHLSGMEGPLALLACFTMTIGNVSAIHQTNLKRLLAYSSVAQAGYMMIGILVASQLGSAAVLFYGLAYLLMNFGAFACAMWIALQKGSYDLDSCDGLALNHLPFALCFGVFLLSLAGIPPLVGFLGKYLLFASAIKAQWAWWIAVVGVLNSVVSVYYYLRITYRMFFVESESRGPTFVPVASSALTFILVALLAGTLIFGIYPAPLLALAGL